MLSEWCDVLNIVASDEQVSEFACHFARHYFFAFLQHYVETAIETDEGAVVLSSIVEFDLH